MNKDLKQINKKKKQENKNEISTHRNKENLKTERRKSFSYIPTNKCNVLIYSNKRRNAQIISSPKRRKWKGNKIWLKDKEQKEK